VKIIKNINWWGQIQIWVAYFNAIGVKFVKIVYQILRSYMAIWVHKKVT
jgi:LPS sulfotransferase NodH